MEEKMDLRIRKTYLALHDAFTELLEEKKFEDITVNELCERAMIRRTTFYKHFADKYEYFAFYLREISDTFRQRLEPDATAVGMDRYMILMSGELVRFMQQHERLVKNGLNSNMLPVLLNILLEQVREDILKALSRTNYFEKAEAARMEGYAAFIAGGILGALFQRLKCDTEINEELFVDTVSRFFTFDRGLMS